MFAPLVALLMFGGSQQAHKAAVLIVRAVDAKTGAPVKLLPAELYLDVWGGGETHRIRPRGNEVRIPLGRDWVCGFGAAWCDEGYLAARIILRAEGYQAVGSDRFTWIGSVEDPRDYPRRAESPARIRFPGPLVRTIRPGTTQHLTVPFRRRELRVLRFVDGSGETVSGVKVTIHELLARTNHCGVAEGPILFEGRTDANGAVPMPLGEVEFSISIFKPLYVIERPSRPYATEVDRRFDETDRTLRLRHLLRRPLRLRFRNADGSPARANVWAVGASCGCGDCRDRLGATDALGRFVKNDFYPEQWQELYVQRGEWADWAIDPRKQRWTGMRVVTLK